MLVGACCCLLVVGCIAIAGCDAGCGLWQAVAWLGGGWGMKWREEKEIRYVRTRLYENGGSALAIRPAPMDNLLMSW